MNIVGDKLYWYFPTQENVMLLRALYDSKKNLNGDVIATSYLDIAETIFNVTDGVHDFKDFYPGPKFWLATKEQYLIKDLFIRASKKI